MQPYAVPIFDSDRSGAFNALGRMWGFHVEGLRLLVLVMSRCVVALYGLVVRLSFVVFRCLSLFLSDSSLQCARDNRLQIAASDIELRGALILGGRWRSPEGTPV